MYVNGINKTWHAIKLTVVFDDEQFIYDTDIIVYKKTSTLQIWSVCSQLTMYTLLVALLLIY